MVCISTVYRFTMVMYFNVEFSGIENQYQGRYEGIVRSAARFTKILLLLHFSGYYLFNIIKISSNITDPDFTPHTILQAHIRIF
jgi:hypothetical protein